jgi:hypothetical protein
MIEPLNIKIQQPTTETQSASAFINSIIGRKYDEITLHEIKYFNEIQEKLAEMNFKTEYEYVYITRYNPHIGIDEFQVGVGTTYLRKR